MKSAKLLTGNVDPVAFQPGIFISHGNVLSTVEIEASAHLGFMRKGPRPMHLITPADQEGIKLRRFDTQHRDDIPEIIDACRNEWRDYCISAGVAVYSARKSCQVNALARLFMLGREPCEEEMEQDLEELGPEKIVGDRLSDLPVEQRQAVPAIKYDGDIHEYLGPMRVEKTIIVTRAFPGDIPADISDLCQELDGVELPYSRNLAREDGYHLFAADAGNIRYVAFDDPEKFSPENLADFGRTEITDNSLTFHPADSDSTVDMTALLPRL